MKQEVQTKTIKKAMPSSRVGLICESMKAASSRRQQSNGSHGHLNTEFGLLY